MNNHNCTPGGICMNSYESPDWWEPLAPIIFSCRIGGSNTGVGGAWEWESFSGGGSLQIPLTPGWWFGTWILFFPYIGNNHYRNWRTHIFQGGRLKPPKQTLSSAGWVFGFNQLKTDGYLWLILPSHGYNAWLLRPFLLGISWGYPVDILGIWINIYIYIYMLIYKFY